LEVCRRNAAELGTMTSSILSWLGMKKKRLFLEESVVFVPSGYVKIAIENGQL
jgi:hypothetical protein